MLPRSSSHSGITRCNKSCSVAAAAASHHELGEVPRRIRFRACGETETSNPCDHLLDHTSSSSCSADDRTPGRGESGVDAVLARRRHLLDSVHGR